MLSKQTAAALRTVRENVEHMSEMHFMQHVHGVKMDLIFNGDAEIECCSDFVEDRFGYRVNKGKLRHRVSDRVDEMLLDYVMSHMN